MPLYPPIYVIAIFILANFVFFFINFFFYSKRIANKRDILLAFGISVPLAVNARYRKLTDPKVSDDREMQHSRDSQISLSSVRVTGSVISMTARAVSRYVRMQSPSIVGANSLETKPSG